MPPARKLSYDWDARTYRSLAWQYGTYRASVIRAGQDPATQADLAAWRNLGGRHVDK